MNVFDDLVLAQRLPNNTGWSWTLASRLGDLLQRAQQQFGQRDPDYTPVGIEFAADGPRIWYPGNCGNIVIQLSTASATDPVEACYQLAQECVHLLSPTGGSDANILEEGASVYFSTQYVLEKFGVTISQTNAKYADAAKLVQTLLDTDADAIRKVRAIQPSFSQITVTNLRDKIPACPMKLAEELLRAF